MAGDACTGGWEDGRRGDALTRVVIGAALHVHTCLGPGLLENVYERVLAEELRRVGHHVVTQVPIPVRWRGAVVGTAYRADLIVERSLLVEIKAVELLMPVHRAQVITYLKLSGLERALLFNFNVPHLKDGLQRISARGTAPPSHPLILP